MTEVQAVLTVLCVAETAAVVGMGMSM